MYWLMVYRTLNSMVSNVHSSRFYLCRSETAKVYQSILLQRAGYSLVEFFLACV